MPTGISTTEANDALDALVASHDWIQLHTGDPGANGTDNVATENTRMQATFAGPANGSVSTNTDLDWTNVPAAEQFTHFSGWDAVTVGTFGYSGTVTANAVGIGDDFSILSGDLTLSFTVAS